MGRRMVSLDRPGPGVDLAAHLFTYSTPRGAARGAYAEVLPVVELQLATLDAEVWSGMAVFVRGGDPVWRRAGLESGVRVARTRATGRLAAAASALVVRGEVLPHAELEAEYRVGRATLFGAAGRWWADVEVEEAGMVNPAASWLVGARLELAAGIGAHGGWRRDSADPLVGVQARSAWTLGLTAPVGRRARPGPSIVAKPAGTVTLVVAESEVPERSPPAVVGDFTGWEAVPMERGAGVWSATFRLSPGVYHFALRTRAGAWFLPSGWPTVDDGFGGRSAVLVVEDPGGSRALR
jgi:hypothetical protein